MSQVTFEDIEAAVPPEEFAASHPGEYGMEGYSNAGSYACKVILAIARRDPTGFKAALDIFRTDPYTRAIEELMTPEERAIVIEGQYGVTGFQWGWAVGTAAWLLEQPPVPNGAILHIGSAS
jgi:hypothetical protein